MFLAEHVHRSHNDSSTDIPDWEQLTLTLLEMIDRNMPGKGMLLSPVDYSRLKQELKGNYGKITVLTAPKQIAYQDYEDVPLKVKSASGRLFRYQCRDRTQFHRGQILI
jgi:hypothetical protein